MDNNKKKLTYEEALAEVRKNKTSSFDRALEEVRSRKSNVTLEPVVVEQQPDKDDNGITEVTVPDKENNIDVPAPKKPAYREWYEKVTSTPVKVKDEPTEEPVKPAEEKTATDTTVKRVDVSKFKIAEGAKSGEIRADNNAVVYGKFGSDGKLKLTEKGREKTITPDMPEEEAFVLATAKTDYDNLTDEEKNNYPGNPNYFKNVANFIKSGKSTKEALELAPGSIEEEIAFNILNVFETSVNAGKDALQSLSDATEEFDIWFENKVFEPSKRFFSGEAAKEIRDKNNVPEKKIVYNPIELLNLFIKQAENEDRKSDVEYKEEMTEHVVEKQNSSVANSYNNFGRGENGYYDTSATMNYSPVGRFITDVSYQFGRMVPTLLAAAATQGASLPAVVPGITMFANGYTSSKANALREGASLEDAERYAHLTNLGEVFTEYLTGGILGFGKGQFDDVAFNAIAKMTTNPYVRASAMGAIKLAGGSLEEVAAGLLDVGAKKITYDPDATVDLGELGYSALLGGFMTLPGAVISGTTEYRATKQTYDMVSDIIGIASKASTPTEVTNAVKFMDSVAGRAQTITEMSDSEIAKTLGIENTPENIAAVRRDYKIIQSEMKRATQDMLENKYRIIAENAQNGVGSQNEKALLTRIVAMAKSGDINGAISLAQSEIDANNASMQELADLTSFSEDEKRALGQTLADRNSAWGEVISSLEGGKVDALEEAVVKYSEDTANADGDISAAEAVEVGEGNNYTTENANAPVSEENAGADTPNAVVSAEATATSEDVSEKNADVNSESDVARSPVAVNEPVSEDNANVEGSVAETVGQYGYDDGFTLDDKGEVVFKQADIDYSDRTMRKGEFNIAWHKTGDNEQHRTVNGHIYGGYGIYKTDYGKYAVTHLQSGLGLQQFDTLKEAKKLVIALDGTVGNPTVTFSKEAQGKPNKNEEYNAFSQAFREMLDSESYLTYEPTAENNGTSPLQNDREGGTIEAGAVASVEATEIINTESKENGDGREEETVSDTKNAESTRRVGKENTAGEGSNRERVSRKNKKILRKSTAKTRNDRGKSGQLEQKENKCR